MQTIQPITLTTSAPTAGTLTQASIGKLGIVLNKYSWTNAMVAAFSGTMGNLLVCTLPAKTLVKSARIVITGQAAGITALTCSLGRTGTAYIDYLVAKSAKAVANTIYGSIIGDIGTNLSAILGDLPSITATTDINLQFVSSIENLSNVTGSSGDIYLETILLS